jgi:hypothetical protein
MPVDPHQPMEKVNPIFEEVKDLFLVLMHNSATIRPIELAMISMLTSEAFFFMAH